MKQQPRWKLEVISMSHKRIGSWICELFFSWRSSATIKSLQKTQWLLTSFLKITSYFKPLVMISFTQQNYSTSGSERGIKIINISPSTVRALPQKKGGGAAAAKGFFFYNTTRFALSNLNFPICFFSVSPSSEEMYGVNLFVLKNSRI